MKISKYIFIVLSFGSLLSCNVKNSEEKMPQYADCDSPTILVGERVCQNVFIGFPGSFISSGDTILVEDGDDEYWFSAISLSGDSLIARCGKIGQGPGELIRPVSPRLLLNGELTMYDGSANIFCRNRDILNFIEHPDSARRVTFKNHQGGVIMATASGYVGFQTMGDGHMLTSYDPEGMPTGNFGLIPGTRVSDDTTPEFYLVNQIDYTVSPDGNKLCAAGLYHDWLAFFDVSSGEASLIKQYYSESPVVMSESSSDSYHVDLLPETKLHFRSIASTDESVYLLYWGVTEEDREKGKVTCSVLHYDWNGRLSSCWRLNEIVDYIYVDEDDKNLYARTMPDVYPEVEILRYNLIE